MLNSILQQKLQSCELVVSIAYTPKNGNPNTESVINYFKSKNLSIIDVVLDKSQIFRRSISRNDRVKNTDADWIVFADADMVYDQIFFEEVAKQLKTTFKKEERVIGADRHSLSIEHCVKFFDKCPIKYPCLIQNPAKILSKWPLSNIAHGRRAAGYFQLVNTDILRQKTSYYSKCTYKDNIILAHYPSDIAFRQSIGGRTRMVTPPQYHINHNRKTYEQK